MIYIKEVVPGDQTVVIKVDGVLDSESIPILKSVCDRHLTGGKKILLHLEGLLHISREGKDFLREIPEKIAIINLPQYTKLETHQ
jgi:hypothetical protein